MVDKVIVIDSKEKLERVLELNRVYRRDDKAYLFCKTHESKVYLNSERAAKIVESGGRVIAFYVNMIDSSVKDAVKKHPRHMSTAGFKVIDVQYTGDCFFEAFALAMTGTNMPLNMLAVRGIIADDFIRNPLVFKALIQRIKSVTPATVVASHYSVANDNVGVLIDALGDRRDSVKEKRLVRQVSEMVGKTQERISFAAFTEPQFDGGGKAKGGVIDVTDDTDDSDGADDSDDAIRPTKVTKPTKPTTATKATKVPKVTKGTKRANEVSVTKVTRAIKPIKPSKPSRSRKAGKVDDSDAETDSEKDCASFAYRNYLYADYIITRNNALPWFSSMLIRGACMMRSTFGSEIEIRILTRCLKCCVIVFAEDSKLPQLYSPEELDGGVITPFEDVPFIMMYQTRHRNPEGLSNDGHFMLVTFKERSAFHWHQLPRITRVVLAYRSSENAYVKYFMKELDGELPKSSLLG